LAWNQLQIDTDMLLIITTADDEFFSSINIDDLERRWTTKTGSLVNFSISCCDAHLKSKCVVKITVDLDRDNLRCARLMSICSDFCSSLSCPWGWGHAVRAVRLHAWMMWMLCCWQMICVRCVYSWYVLRRCVVLVLMSWAWWPICHSFLAPSSSKELRSDHAPTPAKYELTVQVSTLCCLSVCFLQHRIYNGLQIHRFKCFRVHSMIRNWYQSG